MFSTRFLTEHAVQMPPGIADSIDRLARRGLATLERATALRNAGRREEADTLDEVAFATLDAAAVATAVLQFTRYSALVN